MKFEKVDSSTILLPADEKIYTDTMMIVELVIKRRYVLSAAIAKRAKERKKTPGSIRANVTTNLFLSADDWHDIRDGIKGSKEKVIDALVKRYPEKKEEILKKLGSV